MKGGSGYFYSHPQRSNEILLDKSNKVQVKLQELAWVEE
jgi:hypothetical protein